MCVRTVTSAMAACALAMILNMSAFAKSSEGIPGPVDAESSAIESLRDDIEIPEARGCCIGGVDLGLVPFYTSAHPRLIGSEQVGELPGLRRDIQELSAEIKELRLGSLLLDAGLAELQLEDLRLEANVLEKHLLDEVEGVEELRLGTLRAQEVPADLEEV